MQALAMAAVLAATSVAGVPAEAQQSGTPGAPGGGWNQPQQTPAQPMPGGWSDQRGRDGQPMPPQSAPPRADTLGSWDPQPPRGDGNRNRDGWRNGGPDQRSWRAGSRWGGSIGGDWYAGVQAPGGWNAYKRPKRGKTLARYWVSPRFLIDDWQAYGLMAPLQGYYWTRYYNDAVLIDRWGVVYDWRDGIDWDRYPRSGEGYHGERLREGGYPAPQDNGSAGLGYEASGGEAPVLAPIPTPVARGPAAVSRYYSVPGSVTTIVIPGATTTTTTTEFIEETTYVAPTKVWRARAKRWRPRLKPKPRCCPCGCR